MVLEKVFSRQYHQKLEQGQTHGANLNNINASLLAVGGYGRRELYPFSDIDILILLKDYNDLKNKNNIENFIADIWKLKTSVGHSVRDIEECIKNMNKDVTVYTNILDVRFIEGDKKLYNDLILSLIHI